MFVSNAFLVIIFAAAPRISVLWGSLIPCRITGTWDRYPSSRVFPYIVLSFRVQFPSCKISFWWIPWVVHSMASVCLKSYWARDSSQLFFSSRSMFGFLLPHAWFSVFSFHMPFSFYTESVHELLGFFEVRVIISCCIFISELLFGLCFNCQLFLAIPTGFCFK